MADSRPQRFFGVTTDLSGTIGDGIIANSVTHNNSVEVAEARDELGKLINLAPYDENKEISIDGLFVGDGVSVGSVVTINGLDYLVSTSNKTEANTAFQTASVTARAGNEDTVVSPLSAVYNGTINGPVTP